MLNFTLILSFLVVPPVSARIALPLPLMTILSPVAISMSTLVDSMPFTDTMPLLIASAALLLESPKTDAAMLSSLRDATVSFFSSILKLPCRSYDTGSISTDRLVLPALV